MRLTKQELSEYDARLSQCEDAAAEYVEKRVGAFVEKFPKATVEQVREFTIRQVDAAVRAYGDVASMHAAEMYEAMAKASGVKVRRALVDTSDVLEYIEKELHFQAGKLEKSDVDGFIAGASRAARSQVGRRANQTMRVNAKRDGVRYARVPMGWETCTFCAMLASRGFIYKSAKVAGEGNHYHNSCRCKVIPGFEGLEVEGYDEKEWAARWGAFKDLDGMDLTEEARKAAKQALSEAMPTTEAIEAAKETARQQSATEIAARSLAKAAKQEATVTKALQALESETRHLEGLDFRLKGEGSLARKVLHDATEEGKTLAQAADDITDVLRYTYQCDVDTLTSDFLEIREQLEGLGYDWVKVKNSLGDATAPYRGVNTKIKTPDGYEFELQFHTAESLEVKEVNHKLYEEQRVLDTSTEEGKARSDELAETMASNASGIATPPGIEEVKL